MSQPEQEAREAQSSLAPVQVERKSDELDLAGMRGRRGPRIMIAVAVLAVVGFGGFQLLRSMDARQAYAVAADQLERSEVEQREAFMRCALPNQQNSKLTQQAALQGAIEIATDRMGKTYAKVLTKCTPLLDNFQQAVAGVKAPADTVTNVQAVSKAANDFAAAWLGLRDFLQSSGEYDRAALAPRIQAITTAWEAYDTERVKAKQVLSARL
jgi:hypothetical protein